ncbi:two-component sensor histidine kinase [Sphingomonas spermidinifaciens]|uniref:histidine kinase n=1 Tax=Sphingomonas spermidinifaciens TaxID=1141889 RepID=A0A2A4B035_9SPHN|nr:ATP-binding protein [Sphingomonas spermidinifaciens]PCD01781.1 two-component sensor histidine kinase [Sphingomonas spermidinifaciens]
MTRAARTTFGWLIAVALAAALAALIAGLVTRERVRAGLAESVMADARLRAALLDSELARYRLMPLALADDRDVVAALVGTAGAARTLDRKLEALAAATGASVVYVVDARGIAIAASNWRTPVSFVGNDYRFRRYVREAQRTGSAAQFARGTVSGRPGLFFARRASAGGVVVVKLEFDRIQADWARAGGDTFVEDREGIVMVSSRPEWVFTRTRPIDARHLAELRADASLSDAALRPLPAMRDSITARVPAAQPGWTLTLRRAAAPLVWPSVRIAAIGAALAVFAVGALAWGLGQRAALARRRTAELEAAVAARTAALTREIEERAASEARAAELREGLRQANRLATLGQVTASVAHETAQPVAAIRTYAQTSATLLDRGETEAVRDNLATIARLSDRIGTATERLRGFARRRPGPLRPVPLAEVVEGAALILKEQLRGVTYRAPAIDTELQVIGGRVRLEQVLVNLMQNALEALRDRPDPRLTLTVDDEPQRVVLAVEDNGPGIPADLAERLFTPFVTSRAEGLGLGLVIAQDIMVEMGGSLRHVTTPAGARFEIEMVRA